MTKRIFIGIILVSMITMLACTGLVMGVMYDYLGEKIDDELRDEAKMVEIAVECEGAAYLERVAEAEDVESRITLIDSGGEVIFDSEADPERMESHLEREEFREALSSGEGRAIRHSGTMSRDTRYYALKMDDGNILRLSSSHYSQAALIWDTFGIVLAIAVILIALGAVISARIARGIIKPINDIDLNSPDIGEGYEEIVPLLRRIRQQNGKIRLQMENLKKQQNEFKIITENMDEGLIIIDKDMELLTCNSSAIRLLGAANAEKSGTALRLNKSEAFENAVTGALSGNNCRTILHLQDSACEIIANPVYDEGEITGAILIILDITEKEKGEKLRREFTSNVSHELKTPLTSIYGVSDMLSGDLVKAEDVKSFAEAIKEEAARLISLIEDIIKLSKLDENKAMDEEEAVDVLGVAEDVARRLASKAEKASVTLNVSGSSVSVMGSETIIEEIIYNLCDNSIKYNKEGGAVDVSVKRVGGDCLISVKDSGIGIPKSDMKRVFERFYRVDKSRSKATGGTGLGLSIVKHAVAYLGGELDIDSVLGEGTEINIKFRAV